MSFNIKTAAGRYVIASNSSLLVSGKDRQLYSESEMMIGYWTDNKPLYRIVIHDNTYRTGSGVIWNYADKNIDTLVNYHITADGWDAQYHNLYVADAYTSQSTRCSSVCNLADKQIEILIGNIKINSLTLVVEYTKTTDNPVSDLNTYSLDAKFTGETWIDGNPIYRVVAASFTPSISKTLIKKYSTEVNGLSVFEYIEDARIVDLIPSMTADDAPEGICSASSVFQDYRPWRIFNRDITSEGWFAVGKSGWIQYQFERPVAISKISFRATTSAGLIRVKDYNIQYSVDGSEWTVAYSDTCSTSDEQIINLTEFQCNYIRFNIINCYGDGSIYAGLVDLQCYGYYPE